MLIVTGGSTPVDVAEFIQKMTPYVINSKLRTANRNQSHQELIFEISVKKELDLQIIEDLLLVSGVESVNWISEAGEDVG